jgi:uncharacterized repeat protein (TIGR03803 family)
MALAFVIVLLPVLATAPAAEGQTYKVLYNFTGGSDGGYPEYGSLVQDKVGNLYGTTLDGGDSSYGVVFKLTKSGTETVLHSFTGGADGAYPEAGLVLSGNTLYGAASQGGSTGCAGFGCGVVFELNIRTGTQTVLYTFTGESDGGYPGAVVLDKKGNLYGPTYEGGASGYGTVFEVVPKTKKETVLHSFEYTDGANPYWGLALDATEKVLFGTTSYGGANDDGVVFSLTIKSATYSLLYNFAGYPDEDGNGPYGTLALDPKGNLYGTTGFGGASDTGTVFEVVPNTKKETVLYNFTGFADGGYPYGGVIRDKNGNLYGTTSVGGANYYGTTFELVKGTETVLHNFAGSDGKYPFCALIQDSKGDFYGTTTGGGSDGWGVVWEITP